jgi:DNA-binding beta-propeller fold protein YncE
LVNGGSLPVTPKLVNNSSNNICANCLGLVFNGSVAYVSDGTSTLHAYDTDNVGWQSISLSSPAYGLALKDNYLLTTDYAQTLSGFAITSITSTWVAGSQLNVGAQPYGVAIASNGDIYVSNFAASTVNRIHRGVMDPAPFLDATKICHPLGLAINEQTQSLYVASQKGSGRCGLQSQPTGYILRATIDLSS